MNCIRPILLFGLALLSPLASYAQATEEKVVQSTQLDGNPVYWNTHWDIVKKNAKHEENIQKAVTFLEYADFEINHENCKDLSILDKIPYYYCTVLANETSQGVNSHNEENVERLVFTSVYLMTYVVADVVLNDYIVQKIIKNLPSTMLPLSTFENIPFYSYFNKKERLIISDPAKLQKFLQDALPRDFYVYGQSKLKSKTYRLSRFFDQLHTDLVISDEAYPNHWWITSKENKVGLQTGDIKAHRSIEMQKIMKDLSKLHHSTHQRYVDLANQYKIKTDYAKTVSEKADLLSKEFSHKVDLLRLESSKIFEKNSKFIDTDLIKHAALKDTKSPKYLRKTSASIRTTIKRTILYTGAAFILYDLLTDDEDPSDESIQLNEFNNLDPAGFIDSLNANPDFAAYMAMFHDEIIDAVSP